MAQQRTCVVSNCLLAHGPVLSAHAHFYGVGHLTKPSGYLTKLACNCVTNVLYDPIIVHLTAWHLSCRHELPS